MGNSTAKEPLSRQTIKRLPDYYNYLRAIPTAAYISASAIARDMSLNEVQVRKDLAAVSRTPGIPRRGFPIPDLLESISEILGYHNRDEAVLVGAGKLGTALLSYDGFEKAGVRISAAFDIAPHILGQNINGREILPLDNLSPYIHRQNIQIGIIAVPAPHAQGVCDLLVQSGIRAIWNFAPVHLRAPRTVLIQNENMAAQLAALSQHLLEQTP